jgi:hypothetical protein
MRLTGPKENGGILPCVMSASSGDDGSTDSAAGEHEICNASGSLHRTRDALVAHRAEEPVSVALERDRVLLASGW